MFSYIEKLSTIDDFKTFKENNEKVVFVFSAPWCPDCVMLDRFFEDTVNKFNDIKFRLDEIWLLFKSKFLGAVLMV